MSSKKLTFTGVLTLFLLIAIDLYGWRGVVGVEVAHAQNLTIAGTFINWMLLIQGFIVIILDFLTWFLFMILDLIMNPTWMFDLKANGQDGDLMNMLRNIWQLCRDLVNLALALVLIYEAIMMIIKADPSKVKEIAPKFVMALVLVNFSWFIPRAIFDASQVITYTVYQIPSLVGGDGCTVQPSNGPRKPCEMVVDWAFFPENTSKIGSNGTHQNGTTGWRCPLAPLVCLRFASMDDPTLDTQPHSKVLHGLVVNHARLATLSVISDPRPGGVGPVGVDAFSAFGETIGMLAKLVIVLVLHVAIFFPILALTIAFFLRIPILWVTMAFMPLVALGFVIGDKLGEMNPVKVIWEQFLSAVFLPAKVAVPFVIGFIMLNAGATTAAPAAFNRLAPVAVFTGIRDLWQLVWMGIALFIIWKYSFEALKKDQVMGMFSEKIQGFGKSLGDLALKYPLSQPFLPIPERWGGKKGDTASPLQYLKAFSPQRKLGNISATGRDSSIADRLGQINNQGSVTKTISSSSHFTTFQSHINVFKDKNATQAQRDEALKRFFEEFKKHHDKDHPGASEHDILHGAFSARSLAIGDEERKLLEEALARRPHGPAHPQAAPATPTPPPPPPTPPAGPTPAP